MTAEQIALLEQVVGPQIFIQQLTVLVLVSESHSRSPPKLNKMLIPQRLRDRGEHAGGLRSQAEALERAATIADREIALLRLQVTCPSITLYIIKRLEPRTKLTKLSLKYELAESFLLTD